MSGELRHYFCPSLSVENRFQRFIFPMMTPRDQAQKDAAAAAGLTLLLAKDGGSVDPKAAALLCGCSEAALRAAAGEGQVIAIRDETGRVRFPVWQFGPLGGVLPGIKEVLAILAPRTRIDGLTPMIFFLNPTARLGGRSPIQALRLGGESAKAVRQIASESLE